VQRARSATDLNTSGERVTPFARERAAGFGDATLWSLARIAATSARSAACVSCACTRRALAIMPSP